MVPDLSVCIRSCEQWEDYRLSDVLLVNRLIFVHCTRIHDDPLKLIVVSHPVGYYNDRIVIRFSSMADDTDTFVPFPDKIVLRYDIEKKDFFWLNEDRLL